MLSREGVSKEHRDETEVYKVPRDFLGKLMGRCYSQCSKALQRMICYGVLVAI